MKRFACHICLLGATLLGGCAGYKLGPVYKTEFRSVAVPMFKNRTLKPQLEAQVTNAIIKRLQTDGSLAVRSTDDADIVLRGELVLFGRTMLRGQRLDTALPEELRLVIQARIEAHDRVTGAVVLPPTVVSGSADTFVGADQQTAELQALPLIAEELAKKAVSVLVERW
jgi:hypothetical protein